MSKGEGEDHPPAAIPTNTTRPRRLLPVVKKSRLCRPELVEGDVRGPLRSSRVGLQKVALPLALPVKEARLCRARAVS